MKVVYLDTETTSLNPGQICELSMIVEEDFRFVCARDIYFKVKEMTDGAQAVHGLSIEDLDKLSNGLEFKDYKDELLEILSGATLIAHNLPFDEKFISQEFWRCGVSFTPANRLDSMKYFNPILRLPARSKKYGPYKNPKLCEVMEYFRVSPEKIAKFSAEIFNKESNGYHDSAFDTTALYIMINVQREVMNGGEYWYNRFSLV